MIQNVLKFNNNFIFDGLGSRFGWGWRRSFTVVNLQNISQKKMIQNVLKTQNNLNFPLFLPEIKECRL